MYFVFAIKHALFVFFSFGHTDNSVILRIVPRGKGLWDYEYMCDDVWSDPPKYCTDYPGQRGGRFVNDVPVKNRNNRTDVEGELKYTIESIIVIVPLLRCVLTTLRDNL